MIAMLDDPAATMIEAGKGKVLDTCCVKEQSGARRASRGRYLVVGPTSINVHNIF